jgi:glycosyltransferase involved in cell wall biosynthesis
MPWLGYLFDFQHRHLPQFFDEEAVRYRDQLFRRMLTQADAVVVNARDVKNDAERYFPGLTERLFALPFSAAPKAEWLTADVGAARRVHGVGTRYFLVANQFWVHKRHEVAIEAFARLAASHSDLELVLTGATDDIRTPTRLQDIRDFIARLGLSRRIHILGLIPKTEQIALLRGAVAVIQPTSCEGGPGGGSVFDAVALGVPSVVSDIPVNREIAEHVSAYFPLDDVGALTTAMEAMLAAPRLAPDPRVLQAAGAARRTAMGERIWAAAEAAVRHAAPGRRC